MSLGKPGQIASASHFFFFSFLFFSSQADKEKKIMFSILTTPHATRTCTIQQRKHTKQCDELSHIWDQVFITLLLRPQ